MEKSGDALSQVQVHQDTFLFTPQLENIAPMGKVRSINMKGAENLSSNYNSFLHPNPDGQNVRT